LTNSNQESNFLAIVEQFGKRFERLAKVYATTADSDDLLQNIWLQIWRSLDSFKGDAKLETWAYRVALNTALSYRRQKHPDTQEFDETSDTSVTPTQEDTTAILEDFVSSLKPVDRGILLMFLDDQSTDDMAAILGITNNAVAIRLTRLRKLFENRYLDESI